MKTLRYGSRGSAGLLLLGIGLFVAQGCDRPKPTVAVQRDIVAHLALNATVTAPPGTSAAVYSPYQTTVKQVRVSQGERVNKGQVLIDLTIPSAEQALQSAKQSVSSAEAALETARAEASGSVRSAEQQLAAAREAERAARASGESTSDTTTTSSDGTTTVTTTGGGELQSATQERRAAEQAVADARAGVDTALAPLREQLAEARAYLREAQAGRAQGMIRSPIRGTVVALAAQVGQVVGQDRKTPLVTVVNVDKLQIKAPLAAEQVPYVKEDMPVKLTSASWPNQQVEGKVLEIQSNADPKGKGTVYTAVIGVQRDENLIMPNQVLTAAVKLGVAENVVAVPNSALKKGEAGQTVIEVQRNGQWVEVPVQVGLSDGQYTEIKQGVQVGEVIKAAVPMLGSR